MIERVEVDFSAEGKEQLKREISNNKEILNIRFKGRTVILLVLIEVLLLFIIYFTEDYGFSAIFKFLLIVPIWMIIMITFLHYQKRRPAKRIFNLYSHYLRQGKYQAIKVESDSCEYYSDDLFDYFLFNVRPKQFVLLRQQDFEFDTEKFPNNCFVIPPNELLDVIGNKIHVEGNKIIPSKSTNSRMPRLASAAEVLGKG
ncbi:MAG: hypothetical protein ABFS32_22675 [Bacteroidota bacterium]